MFYYLIIPPDCVFVYYPQSKVPAHPVLFHVGTPSTSDLNRWNLIMNGLSNQALLDMEVHTLVERLNVFHHDLPKNVLLKGRLSLTWTLCSVKYSLIEPLGQFPVVTMSSCSKMIEYHSLRGFFTCRTE